MKHGEGITLTLTGRCPILCWATINNMAASGTFALEKEVHSESHVLTASCRGLTTFLGSILLPFCVIFVWGFGDPNYLVVLWSNLSLLGAEIQVCSAFSLQTCGLKDVLISRSDLWQSCGGNIARIFVTFALWMRNWSSREDGTRVKGAKIVCVFAQESHFCSNYCLLGNAAERKHGEMAI